ncbi:MAG: multidrug transporter AcrB, partial [Desulfobacterales bacterium CG23_combo_of_CG06-09_8_20_14_all_51_8]
MPILALTFWSDSADHYTLRRVAAEIEQVVKREPDASITTIIGGTRRQMEVRLNPARLSAYGLDGAAISQRIAGANAESQAGSYPSPAGQVLVQVGGFLETADDVRRLVVGVVDGRPIYLEDVAEVMDGPAEPDNYVFFGAGPAAEEIGIHADESKMGVYPAVTLTVAKRKGTNAVSIAEKVLKRIEETRG